MLYCVAWCWHTVLGVLISLCRSILYIIPWMLDYGTNEYKRIPAIHPGLGNDLLNCTDIDVLKIVLDDIADALECLVMVVRTLECQ